MAKVLNLWESDTSKLPVDPNERIALWGKQIEATKQMLDAGKIYDWGLFASGGGGYGIGSGDAKEVLKNILPFVPNIKFSSHLVLSIDEVMEVLNSMKG